MVQKQKSTSPTNPSPCAASTPTPTSTSTATSTAAPSPQTLTPRCLTSYSTRITQQGQERGPQHHYHSPASPSHLAAPHTTARLAILPAQDRKSLPGIPPAPAAAAIATAAVNSPAHQLSMASVISPIPGQAVPKAPVSMTTKEWIIPPRPKPGRKPATDTPPTKRKAQNRAAQRAFRERRAARVGELEEQLEAEREDHEKAQIALQDKFRQFELDAQALQSRCEVLENMLDKERVERTKEVEALRQRLHEATQNRHHRQSLPSISEVPKQPICAPQPLRNYRPSVPSRLSCDGTASISTVTSVATTPTKKTHKSATPHSLSISQMISPPEDNEQASTGCGSCEPDGPCACADEALGSIPLGCGNCTFGSRCQCIEEVLNGTSSSNDDADSRTGLLSSPPLGEASRTAKRTIHSVSPSFTAPGEKRQRGSSLGLDTEIDFTAMFSRRPKPIISSLPSPAPINAAGTPQTSTPITYSLAPIDTQAADSPAPEDRCGFCEDGTYCVCAEAARNENLTPPPPPSESIVLPSINPATLSVQQARTPPPSEGDAIGYEILPDGSVKLPSLKGLRKLTNRSVNTAIDNSLSAPSSGCGPGGPGTCAQCLADPISGLFCRSLAASFKKDGKSSSGARCGGGIDDGASSIKLSCADAFKTLSRHRHFNEAADDLNTWLPLLKAAPKPREPKVGEGQGGSSRTPIEVEAASIMSVLKGFDVRFGRGL